MKLVFNKNDTGIVEMQKYFSHISGTLDFVDMYSDVLIAHEELHKYVGKAVVDEAVNFYNTTDFEKDTSGLTAEEKAAIELSNGLVYCVQMAVALLGYREFALNNDATHTKTGRIARMDKDTDQVEDKLIDRDDRALVRKGQIAIDRLIKYVDDNQIGSWVSSDLYKDSRDLVLWNATIFHRFHPIEYSHRLFMLLVPMIRTAQVDHVEQILGKDRMAALMVRIRANSLSGDASGSGEDAASMRELNDKVASPIAYLALSAGYRELPTQLFPESMSRQFWNAGNGLAFVTLRDKVIMSLREEGMRKLQVLMHYIEALEAEEAGEEITDETITTIAERMDTGSKFVRV